MKLEVGMYVRTKKGLIAKYIGINNDYEYHDFDGRIQWFYEYYRNEIDFDNWEYFIKEQNSYGTRLQKVGKTKIGNKNNSKYSVICVELNKEFYDVPDAIKWCKENNIKANASCLYNCICGKRKTTGGYHWEKGCDYH